jgi:hypothetical protein
MLGYSALYRTVNDKGLKSQCNELHELRGPIVGDLRNRRDTD